MLAERLEFLVHVPRPYKHAGQKRNEQCGEDVRLAQDKDAGHENDVDDDTPYETGERDRPGLTL